MSVAQQWGSGLIAVAMVTTLVLPGRQSAGVINALQKLISGTLGTAMGTSK